MARIMAGALLAVSVLACNGAAPVHGRYYQGLAWVEFGPNGRALHGDLGGVARFRTDQQDRQKLVVFDPNGSDGGTDRESDDAGVPTRQ